jgi:dimethylargininase
MKNTSPAHSFTRAIVRLPAPNFAQGLTSVSLGVPDFSLVLEQHARYCEALEECGLSLTVLDPDPDHPDSTFVEDTAILTPRRAIISRPGASSREDEAAAMGTVLRRFYPSLAEITAPGTLDGGDICETGTYFFLGVSHRTNPEGARQLAANLDAPSAIIDIRAMSSILHLKSGIASIGDNTLVVIDELAGNELFRGYELIRVASQENYAANCVRVNDRVLVPSGYPLLAAELKARGFHPLPLEMSEFRKMDGGLSCLSLRF